MNKENVVKNLRAVLCSSKGNFTLRKANSDYVGLTGRDIPFKELGYKSLVDFISSEPTFFMMAKPNGEIAIQAMPEEKSVHMINLVQRAKTSRKPLNKKLTLRHGETTRRKPAASNSWSPNKNFKMKSPTYGSGRIAQHSSVNNQQPLKNRLRQANVSLEQQSPKSTNQLPKKKENVEIQHKNTKKKSTEVSNKNINTGASLSRNSSMNSSTFSRQSSIDSNISATGSNNEVGALSPSERITNIINRKSVDSIDIVKDIPKEILRNEPLTDIKFNEILERTFAHQNKPSRATSLNSTDDFDDPVFDYPEVNEFIAPKSPNEYNQLRAWPESSVPWLQSSETNLVDNSPTKSRGRGRTIPIVTRALTSSAVPHVESDPCSDIFTNLMDLIKKLKLGGSPKITFKSRIPKYGPSLMLAKLKIGEDYSCSTWPTEFPAEESARLAVLRKAYIELSEKLSRMTDEDMPESDPSVIGARLIPIVKNHSAGIWADTVEELYRKQFKEQLPSNWLPIAKKQNLSVEYAANGKCILCVDMAPKKTEQVEKSTRTNFSIQSRLKRSPVSKEIDLAVSIPEIEFPSSQWWYIFVTNGVSTCNLWFQIIGNDYSKKFETLLEEMESYFSESEHDSIVTFNEVKEGNCYAAFENEMWMRIRVLKTLTSVDSDNIKQEFLCLAVDFGHEYKLTANKLHVLPTKLAVLPAQAIRCSLCGLEELVDIEFVNSFVEELIGHQLCAEIVEKLENSEFGKFLNVTLYDTSESADDLCINRDIINKVYNKVPSPLLNNKGSLLAMTCSFIDENNDVYLHRTADEQNSFIFNELMERMAISLEEEETCSEFINDVKKVDSSTCYLAKYMDNIWYRCKIQEVYVLKNAVKIMYIDFGNTQIVEFTQNEHLIQLDKVSNILPDFPPQCIKAKLYHTVAKMPPDTNNKLQNILQENSDVIVKVSVPSENSTQLPVIELFQRLKPDDQLISINKQLDLVKSESKKQDNNNNKSECNTSKLSNRLQKNSSVPIFSESSYSLMNIPSTGNIPKPKLPELKKIFHVRVPNASSPWNFFVQPYVSGLELKSFMEKLQQFYNLDNYKKSSFQLSDIKQGEVYAACHLTDSLWYRTCVNKVIDKNSISAYFIDFGAYVVLKSDQLLPLDDQFKQFPFQAMKARLTGVCPFNDKWTVEGCKIFQEIVVGNVFVAYLEEISTDVFNSADILLDLKLIDTSKSETEDYHINKILIEKGIAMASSSRPSSISSNTSN